MCPRRSSGRWRSSCSRASLPTRPPSASSPPSTCCWSLDNFEHLLAAAPFIGTAAGCLSRAHGPRHQSRTARAARRGALPRVAAGAARRRDGRGPGGAGRRGRRRAVLRARASPRSRLWLGRRQRRRGRGDLPARRRAAAGDRAGGRPLRTAVARPRSPSAWTTALGALGAGARDAPARQQTLRATIDWSHDLLSDAEKACFARFAVFAGGATVEAAETITARGPRHARRPGRQEPARAPPARARADAAGDARDDPRLRRRALRGRRRRARPSASATTATSSRWPNATESDRALMGRGPPGAPRPARRRDRQPPRRPRVGGRPGQRRTRRSRCARRSVGTGVMRNRYADAVNWIDQALSMPGADAHPALRVRAAMRQGPGPVAAGARAEQPAALAEAEAIARALGGSR